VKRFINIIIIYFILDKPIVIIEEENLTVTAGDQVTIECMVEANPMNLSLLEWYPGIAINNVSKCLSMIQVP
jgi:hypothetical protein